MASLWNKYNSKCKAIFYRNSKEGRGGGKTERERERDEKTSTMKNIWMPWSNAKSCLFVLATKAFHFEKFTRSPRATTRDPWSSAFPYWRSLFGWTHIGMKFFVLRASIRAYQSQYNYSGLTNSNIFEVPHFYYRLLRHNVIWIIASRST